MVMYTAQLQLVALGNTMLLAEHYAMVHIFATPMCAPSSGIAADVIAIGCRHASCGLQRRAWACRLRAALRCPGLTFAVQRADAPILEDQCPAPRVGEWLQRNIIADLCVALHHAAGAPPNIHEHPKPQSPILRILAAEAGAGFAMWWLVA